jgi:hypothetical protein
MEFETSLLTSSHIPSNTITSTSSPLEVLSNAAALIETKSCGKCLLIISSFLTLFYKFIFSTAITFISIESFIKFGLSRI